MAAKLLAAFGYQGGRVELAGGGCEWGGGPVRRVVLERDGVRMGPAENGGDPEQDGCAFHTDDVAALREEFEAGGVGKVGEIKSESRQDELCFWFGEKIP